MLFLDCLGIIEGSSTHESGTEGDIFGTGQVIVNVDDSVFGIPQSQNGDKTIVNLITEFQEENRSTPI